MGTLRLILALGVALSHAELRIFELNPGVTAVIGFYLISGYVMAGLVDRHYGRLQDAPRFYVDRVLRIYPQYLFYAALTLAWFLATGARTLFLTRDPTWGDLLNNVLVMPLNLYMYNGSDAFTLIPPAWSLGAELQFYLLVPVMLIWPRVGVVLCAASLAVHAMAWHGRVDTDWYGYRLLPGVLWVFGVGMLLFHWHRRAPRLAALLAAAAPLLALAVYAYLRARNLHAMPYHQEVLVGWGLGVPLVQWLARRPVSRWDAWAGDVSYGTFLNHFLLIWILFPEPGRTPLQWAALGLASVALSWLTQRCVEKPVLAYRRRLRKNL